MKPSALLLVAVATLALASCSEEERLAAALEGSWSGAPERFTVSDAAVASLTPVYTFELADGNKKGGNLSIASMISATMPVSTPTDSIVLPFQVTVSALATIEGTWQAIDDDRVSLNLNMQTLNVVLNPDNITAADDALTDQTLQYWQTNRPAAAKRIKDAIQMSLETRYMGMRQLDDVEIHDDVLEHEVGHTKFYLHRTSSPM